MKVMFVTADYEGFLADHYAASSTLATAGYEEQLRARYRSLFSGADSFSKRFRAAGHDAVDVYANNPWIQSAWLRDVGGEDDRAPRLIGQRLRAHWRARVPETARRVAMKLGVVRSQTQDWMYPILQAQLDHYRPEIVVNMSMDFLDHAFFRSVRRSIGALVGFHSAVALPQIEMSDYDLVVASFPPTVHAFEAAGVKTLFVRLAFEADVLGDVPPAAYPDRDIPLSFVGAFSGIHSGRTKLLEFLCRRVPELRVWAPDIKYLPHGACLANRYEGRAWGRKMYEVIGRSRVVVNAHGDIPPYAANSRMYEATGCGALLVSDWKPDLHEVFRLDEEMRAYRNPDECARCIVEALEDVDASERIAASGQRRTLQDHTYDSRVGAMIASFEDIL